MCVNVTRLDMRDYSVTDRQRDHQRRREREKEDERERGKEDERERRLRK